MSELLAPIDTRFLEAYSEEMIAYSRHNAKVAYSGNELMAAEQILRSALACFGKDAGMLADLGVVLYTSGRQDEGFAINEWALRIDPSQQDALNNRQAMQSTAAVKDADFDPFLPLFQASGTFATDLLNLKNSLGRSNWYPYSSMTNFGSINQLLTGDHRDLLSLIANRPVADIACADGDVGFFFERLGCDVDLFDQASTNMNELQGARELKEAMNANVSIYDIDIDAGMHLPRDNYGMVFFLGILYHLKNPFLAMETLSRVTEWCMVSTRVAANDPAHQTSFGHLPMAYLVDTRECNNDSSNFWMFTNPGLKRFFDRSGWDIHDYVNLGDTVASDPANGDHDERAYVLLRSRRH